MHRLYIWLSFHMNTMLWSILFFRQSIWESPFFFGRLKDFKGRNISALFTQKCIYLFIQLLNAPWAALLWLLSSRTKSPLDLGEGQRMFLGCTYHGNTCPENPGNRITSLHIILSSIFVSATQFSTSPQNAKLEKDREKHLLSLVEALMYWHENTSSKYQIQSQGEAAVIRLLFLSQRLWVPVSSDTVKQRN